jgi:HK97 family phage major capsid protein
LGRPTYEAEEMDGTLGTGNDYVLCYGDFDAYVIADRLAMSVEVIPWLFGANNRPTGQRGLWGWYRTGADSVNDGGLKVLRI